jgi:hypothetical protein
VFPEKEFETIDNEDGTHNKNMDSSKVYKIKYSINLLPLIGTHIDVHEDENGVHKKQLLNDDVQWMRLIENSEEIDIYNTEAIKPLIDFKWNQFGKRHHVYSIIVHFIHVLFVIFYVNYVYI